MIRFLHLWLSRLLFVVYLAWKALFYGLRYTLPGQLVAASLVIAAIYLGVTRIPVDLKPLPQRDGPVRTVVVPSGASFQQVADSLAAQDLLEHRRWFLLLGKLTGTERRVHAGTFDVPVGLSTIELLRYVEYPRVKRVKVTFPEGIDAATMAGIAAAAVGCDSAAFMRWVNDTTLARTLLDSTAVTLDGYLMPETYFVELQTPARQLVELLTRATLAVYDADSVRSRLDSLGMSRHEIQTLASIVEGEALVDSERVVIASLYHNRLQRRMRLQADPTIQYILPGPPRRLLYRDLEIDSPYNTYRYGGLPPGPINNPGRASILAALFPADTDYLYMVAFGDGSHKFSKTLREHNYWHQRFNEVRRRERRNRR